MGVLLAYLSTFKKFKEIGIYGMDTPTLTCRYLIFSMYFNIISYNHINPFKTIVIITFFVAIVSMIAIVILFTKLLPVRPAKKLIPISLIRQFVFFSSMAYIGNIATFFNDKLDFWVIDAYWGKSDLGIYSLAELNSSLLLWILPQAVASVLYS